MAVQFLKKAKQMMPERSVKYLLHNHLSGPDKARPLATVHASELTKPDGLCPRFYALADVTKMKPKDNWLTTSQIMTYQIGRDQEKNIVNWFADMGKAVCHWKCVACGKLHEFQKRPMACEDCGIKRFDPVEVRFQSAVNGASCGVDMLLALGEPLLRPVELKTMGADEFKALLAPLAEHRLRTNLYLRLISESDSPWASMVNTSEADVLYVSKGGYGCADTQLKAWGLSEGYSPFKEFVIKRQDVETGSLAARAKVVKDFRAGLIGMPCGVCTTALAKKAINCQKKTDCFSGAFPPEHDWKVPA